MVDREIKEVTGDYDDWTSNLTETDETRFVICGECGSYVRNDKYWYINEEILCEDCARMKYQRGVAGRYEEEY